MRIITISREFGSGGRELGKRLADALHMPCYDHEIIEMVARRAGLDEAYVAHVSERDIRMFYPTTIAHRLLSPHPAMQQPVSVAAAEQALLKTLASEGDCVIVGRCADVVLCEHKPLNLFVYADAQSKLTRCQRRAEAGAQLTERELMRRMKQIDRERAAYRELFTESEWGRKEAYHLCVNTSGREIKALIPALADYARCWFGGEGGWQR